MKRCLFLFLVMVVTPLLAQPREPAGYEIQVPSDPAARFWVLEKHHVTNNGRLITIVTKRLGKTGMLSYSRREYDCLGYRVRYVGTGDSWLAMENDQVKQAMAPIISGSIADYVGKDACKGYN